MPQVERQQSVLELLEDFRGLDSLRELFWTELSYNRVNQPLSRRQWTDRQREALAEDPILWASAAGDNGFHVIYSRFDDDRLLLTKERLAVNKLLSEHPYALFLFSNNSQDLWHFVNVKYDRDRARSDDERKRPLLRRITIGPEERLRTASERIAMLDVEAIASSTLFQPTPLDIQAVHDDAFDVEAVTKRFFDEFTGRFAELQGDLAQQTGDTTWAHDYALRFLSRLMFLYFVQRKRWLGDEPDFLATFWRSYQKSDQPPDSFFDRWLTVLFFEAFNNSFHGGHQHFSDDMKEALATAPYLNGGLFAKAEPDYKYDFSISDAQFGRVFNFLEGYNFTIAEDTPLDQEVAVDPEMIGKVYESLVNIGTEDLRGEAGIFYTPRLEIEMMSRLALVDYLSNHLGEEHKNALYEAAFALDDEDKEQADGGLAEAGLWPQLNDLLEEVTICDPACGSGSFLVTMLLLLADLRERAQQRLGLGWDTRRDRYELKQQIIGENLYGVDVKEWAVCVAELRLWLQLIVDAELDLGERKMHALLPNLSFKVRQGDSLVQEVAGIDLSHIHGRTQLPQGMKGRLTKLLGEKRRYFRGGSEADEQRIRHEERRFFQDLLAVQEKRLLDERTRKHQEKRALDNRLVDVELSQKELGVADSLKQEIEDIEQQVEEVRQISQTTPQAAEVPFIWDMAFAEVFESERGGFDIVVGNPPYVTRTKIAPPELGYEDSTQKQRDQYKNKLRESIGALYPRYFAQHQLPGKSNDLYVYFYLHGLSLLNPQGSFCFVTSNSWLDVSYGKDLQEFLLRHGHIKMILDNQVKRTFAASDVNTIIALLAPPDDTSDWGLDKTARFVMFIRPFEDVLHPVIFEEIEEATERLTKADYRLRVLNQQEMLAAGTQAPEERRGPTIKVGKYTGDKWGGKYLRAPDVYWEILERAEDRLVRLDSLGDVRIGLMTGANDWFFVRVVEELDGRLVCIQCDDADRSKHIIESEFVQWPVLTKAREITTPLINPDKLSYRVIIIPEELRKLPKHLANYVRWGETEPRAYHRRPFFRGKDRSNWYRHLGERAPSDVAIPIGHKRRPLVGLLSDALVSDNFAEVALRDRASKKTVAGSVLSVFSLINYEIAGRANFGQGLLKTQTGEIASLAVLNPDALTQGACDEMERTLDHLSMRPPLMVYDEVRRRDRFSLDDAFLRAVGFDDAGERAEMMRELQDGACRMIWTRMAKSGNAREACESYDEWLASGKPFGLDLREKDVD